ncbi:hypothetical protein Tco_0054071 [Tanacetum coccineum]
MQKRSSNVKMDDPKITTEEYIRLEEEKSRRHGKVYNWETATYAIVFNDTLTSEAALLCEPTVSSLNNGEIDFRISFNESDDEDCTVVFDKNSFSYKIIYVNNLKTDLEKDNDKVNMPLLPSPKLTGDLSVKPLPDVINTDVGAYAHRYQYGVSWGMDMAYRLLDLREVIDKVG